MKKLCLALLVLSMLCGLCACGVGSGGGSTMTTEEMLEVAATLDPSGFYEAVSENKLRAEDDYVGNIYAFTNFVYRIEDDHAEIGPSKQASIRGDALRVYLPEDELKSLSKGEKITVVGELTSLEEMKTPISSRMSLR